MNRLALPRVFTSIFTHAVLEQSHHDVAVENGANSAPFHPILTGIIRAGCTAAIKIAERI
jgi:demethoxyubiquinone hydroxylase (CLK1/Coq7/Cat5 family)